MFGFDQYWFNYPNTSEPSNNTFYNVVFDIMLYLITPPLTKTKLVKECKANKSLMLTGKCQQDGLVYSLTMPFFFYAGPRWSVGSGSN